MSRRIDIELTSDRNDGTWTWRAAGAKQPKGVLKAELLPEGATVGQELRAEVEADLDGTEVIGVMPPKTKNRSATQTLELIARPVSDDELVTSKLAGKKGRDRGDRGDRGERGGRGKGGGRGDRSRGPRSDGDKRGGGENRGGGGGRGGDSRGGNREGGNRSDRPRRDRPAPPPAKPKAKRLRPGRVHRKAALEALPEAEQVIAEQVLRGGVPAVRQAIDKQNEAARAAGGREVSADALMGVAERLLPALRSAEWLDKAEAALKDLDELDLRDLRSVVVAAETGAKDDESRELATKLRDGLTARLDKEQTDWITELTETLAEGRVVRALRLSSRPPKAGAPLPAPVAVKLAEAASGSLTADTMPDRWATVLDAVSYSPVRLQVVPTSRPAEPSEELIKAVTLMADRVPKVAEAFGIDPSAAPARKRSRGGKPGGKPGAKRKPPRPPKPPKPAADAPKDEAPKDEAPKADAAEATAPTAEAAPEAAPAAEPEAAKIDEPTVEAEAAPAEANEEA